MRHARQDLAGAEEEYLKILKTKGVRRRTMALSYRGLGLALLAAGADEEGLAELRTGVETDSTATALLVEAVTLAVRHGDPTMALDLADAGPRDGAGAGRLTFLRALALAREGHKDQAAAILRAGVEIPDLREGEDAIAELWEEVCPGEAVPPAYRDALKAERSLWKSRCRLKANKVSWHGDHPLRNACC